MKRPRPQDGPTPTAAWRHQTCNAQAQPTGPPIANWRLVASMDPSHPTKRETKERETEERTHACPRLADAPAWSAKGISGLARSRSMTPAHGPSVFPFRHSKTSPAYLLTFPAPQPTCPKRASKASSRWHRSHAPAASARLPLLTLIGSNRAPIKAHANLSHYRTLMPPPGPDLAMQPASQCNRPRNAPQSRNPPDLAMQPAWHCTPGPRLKTSMPKHLSVSHPQPRPRASRHREHPPQQDLTRRGNRCSRSLSRQPPSWQPEPEPQSIRRNSSNGVEIRPKHHHLSVWYDTDSPEVRQEAHQEFHQPAPTSS